jgi:hypothetical protein
MLRRKVAQRRASDNRPERDVQMATRIDDVIIERCGSEMVVFVPVTNEAHSLNRTASLIFDLCDGVTTRAQMVGALQDVGLPADASVVNLALAELVDASLVVLDDPRQQLGVSRRTVIRRLGLSATAIALLPVVETILVQPAAAQMSGTTTTTSTTTSTTTFTSTTFTTT